MKKKLLSNNINIEFFILLLPILLVMVAFFGLTFSWASFNHYDSWRLIEFSSVAIGLILFNIYFHNTYVMVERKYIYVIAVCLSLMIISILQAKNPLLAVMDMLWIIILLSYGYILTHLQLKLSLTTIENLLATLSLAPIYVMIWFFIGYYLYITQSLTLAWHDSFENIRYYDDALLPCLLFLWCRIGFLNKYPKFVILVSSLYILTLWVDAARATLLGLAVGLVVASLMYPKGYKKLASPILSVFLSFLCYQILVFWQSDSISQSVVRSGSSNRIGMWTASFYKWLENPFLGIGGANFTYLDRIINIQQLGHPHNLIIQLVLEWGFVGILISCFFIFGIFYIWQKRGYISVLLFSGCVTLTVNILLSGAYIYPISQIAMLLYFSFTLSNIYRQVNKFGIESENQSFDRRSLVKVKLYPSIIGLLAVIGLFLIIYPSLLQFNGVINSLSTGGPRFWYDARLVNLIVK